MTEDISSIAAIIDGNTQITPDDSMRDIVNFIFMHENFHDLAPRSKDLISNMIVNQLSNDCSELSNIDLNVPDVDNIDNEKNWSSIQVYIDARSWQYQRIVDDVGNTFFKSNIKFAISWPGCGATQAKQTKAFLSKLILATQLCSDLNQKFGDISFYRCGSTVQLDAAREEIKVAKEKQSAIEQLTAMNMSYMRIGKHKRFVHIEELPGAGFQEGEIYNCELNKRVFSFQVTKSCSIFVNDKNNMNVEKWRHSILVKRTK